MPPQCALILIALWLLAGVSKSSRYYNCILTVAFGVSVASRLMPSVSQEDLVVQETSPESLAKAVY